MSNLSHSGVTLRMPLALLLVSSLVTGVALTANDASTANVETPAIGAWLGTDDTGVVSHVGPAGVDASVEIRPPVGQLRVHVVDGHVVLSDEGGNVTRLDDAALAVGQEEQIATSARLAGGGDRLYTIDAAANSVQEIDSTELLPLGDPVRFDTGANRIGLGDAVVDDAGTLWVADGANGSVLEILGSDIVNLHDVTAPGVELDLALTDAGAIAVDPSTRTVQIVGSGTPYSLPFTTAMSTPEQVDGTNLLPIVADGQVALIDPATGALEIVDLGVGGNVLGAPVVAGNRVLIPDLTDGVLRVVELDSATAADDISLPEQTDDFEMISDGSVAYVNDRTSTNVWIIAPDGSVIRDDKFDPDALDGEAASPDESDESDDAGDEIEIPAPPPATPPSADPAPRPPLPQAPSSPAPPASTPPTTNPDQAETPTATTPTTDPGPPQTDPPNNDPAGDGSVTIDSVTAGVGTATVFWSAPTDWLTVDRYLVRIIDENGAVVQEQPLRADITQFEAQGLANGVEHRFEITASSGDTIGVSVLSSAVRPDVLGDGSVTDVVASASAGTVTVDWAEPVGWYEVDEYVVVVTGPDGDVDVEQVNSDVFTYTTSTVTNGTTYIATVSAVGVDGQQGPDVASGPVTPIALVPTGDGAVTNVVATAGNTTANATWDEPTDWYAVTGYDVTVLNDDGSEFSAASVNPSGTSAAVSGLVNGDTYQLQITALSDQGPAVPTVSDPITPLGDGSVTNLVVAAGDGSVQADWAAPTGWHQVTGYVVEIAAAGIAETIPATATSYSRAGLTNGQTYTLEIRPVRATGPDGATVASAPFTPAADLPSEPTGVTVLTAANTILLSWQAPAVGSVGTYFIEAIPNDGTPSTTQTIAGTRTSVELRTLANGVPHDVVLHAVHPGGALGAAVTLNNITPGGPPDPPGVTAAPTSSADGTSVTLQWTAPDPNGSAIADYLINGQQVGGPVVANDVVVGVSTTSFTVTGLQPTTQYSFTVAARNGIGRGVPTTFATVTTATPAAPTPAPNQPQNLQGAAGQTTVDLSWAAPVPNAATLASYEISIAGNNPVVLAATTRLYQWTGLASSQSFTFVLVAIGDDGQRSSPTAVTVSTTAPPPPPPPSTPTNVSASMIGQNTARISWTQPNPTAGLSWRIGYTPTLRETSSTTSVDLTGLTPGTTYTILVWAVAPGDVLSGSSAAINFTTASPPPIPGAVGNLRAEATLDILTVNWSAVAGADGYRISVDGGAVIDLGDTTSYLRNNFTSNGGTVTVWAYNISGESPPSTVPYIDECTPICP